MPVPNMLQFLENQERREVGLYGLHVAEQAKYLEWVDEEEAKGIETLKGPGYVAQPWDSDNWNEFGENAPVGMGNVLEVTNPYRSYMDRTGKRDEYRFVQESTYQEPFIEHYVLGRLSSPSTTRLIRNNHAEQVKEWRKTLKRVMYKKHDNFTKNMRRWLRRIHTMVELYALVDCSNWHDQYVIKTYGWALFDTFAELESDFIACETRIRNEHASKLRAMAIVVDTYHPAKLRKGQVVMISGSKREEDRLIADGYIVIARAR